MRRDRRLTSLRIACPCACMCEICGSGFATHRNTEISGGFVCWHCANKNTKQIDVFSIIWIGCTRTFICSPPPHPQKRKKEDLFLWLSCPVGPSVVPPKNNNNTQTKRNKQQPSTTQQKQHTHTCLKKEGKTIYDGGHITQTVSLLSSKTMHFLSWFCSQVFHHVDN